MSEVAFIGDIHGSPGHLERLLPEVLHRSRRLVFLGDYVNRGPDSERVIEMLIHLKESPDLSTEFLEGNHDRILLQALRTGDVSHLLRAGGAPTISSYLRDRPKPDVAAQLVASVPQTHVVFLESLKKDILIDGVYASHSSGSTDGRNDTKALFRVFGHSPRPDRLPSITTDEALIDTGCGTLPDGRLTALFWPSLEWTQST